MSRHEQFNVNELTVTVIKNQEGLTLQSAGTTVPVDGTVGYAKGATFVKTDAAGGAQGVYINVGTTLAANFDVLGTVSAGNVTATELATGAVTSGKIATGVLQVASIPLVRADIISASPIKELVAAPAAGFFLQLLDATISFKFGTAAYAGGGNLAVAYHGGAAISSIAAAATSFGIASGANINALYPLAVTAIIPVVATALDLITSGQFTDVGATATGAALVTIAYRVLPIQA